MDALIIMLKNVIVFVALAIPGYLLIKTKKLKKEHSAGLSAALMYVGMPFLIFNSMMNNIKFSRELIGTMAIVLVLGIAFYFAMFFVSAPLTRMERNEKTKGMMRFSAVFANNGFLGIPLAMAVFGADSGAFMVLILINIVTNVLLYTLGIYLVSGDKSAISLKKAFLNPVLIAFIIGAVANLVNVKELIPEVATYSNHFSSIVTPISMTILGMKMGEIKFADLFKSWRTYYVSAIKLVAFPVLATCVVFILNKFWDVITTDVILGVLVAYAMPTAGLASTFADSFGGDNENAVAFTLGSTILSILTIPLLYWAVCLLV